MVELFSFEYPLLAGGIGQLVRELGEGLKRRGVEVRVLTQMAGGTTAVNGWAAGVDGVPAGRPWRELAAASALRRLAAGTAVVSARWYPEGLLGQAAGAARAGHHVILAHGLELLPRPERWRRALWRQLMRSVLHSARLVVANSRYTAGLVAAAAPRARVAAIPLGVDTIRFSPGNRAAARARFEVPDGRRVVLTVSRLVPHKGHSTVLQALAGLPAPVREQLVYLVGGTGPFEAALRRQAGQLGVAGQVRWLGPVAGELLPELYRAADLFVMCSEEDRRRQWAEGFGLVFLEAQACGVPVVGARTGGIPEAIVPGEGGWLIDAGDAAELARILRRLVERPAVFAAAGQAGRARVAREATWDHYAGRFAGALREVGIAVE